MDVPEELNRFIKLSEWLEEVLEGYSCYSAGDNFLTDFSGIADEFESAMLRHWLMGEANPHTQKDATEALWDLEAYEVAIVGLLPEKGVPTCQFAGRVVTGVTGHSLGIQILREILEWWERRLGPIGKHSDGIKHAKHIVRRERFEVFLSARRAQKNMLAAFIEADSSVNGDYSSGGASWGWKKLADALECDTRTVQKYSSTARGIRKPGRGSGIPLKVVLTILRELQEQENTPDGLRAAAARVSLQLSGR